MNCGARSLNSSKGMAKQWLKFCTTEKATTGGVFKPNLANSGDNLIYSEPTDSKKRLGCFF